MIRNAECKMQNAELGIRDKGNTGPRAEGLRPREKGKRVTPSA